MSWFSIDVRCDTCDLVEAVLVPRDQRDQPTACTMCGQAAHRVPSVLNTTRRTFVDGTKRFDSLRAENAVEGALSEAVAKGDQVSAGKLAAERTRLTKGKS